jgi:hypothetical protein
MLQIVFSGEAGAVNALHAHVLSRMPKGPHGAIKHQTRLKENVDGVTARLSLEVPPEFCDVLFGNDWRSAGMASAGGTTDIDTSAAPADRYKIDYRGGR